MINLKQWLTDLGLADHATTFSANGIGGDVVCDLTDADLKELGLNLGDRKRLLKAIAALDTTTPTPVPASKSEAERRQLTVMFVDLVGSTALSARLDPEEMREVIRAYQNAVAGEISRFEGHVAKFMGDGVLVYFGWPRAHEDEAERAVRAGLAIVALVGKLTGGGEAMACRVGIATGLVVVGDLVGEGAAQEEAVIGETPNLAARLQEVAKPGAVVVADGTRRLLGEMFDLHSLGRFRLKGFTKPVTGYRVVSERRADSRFEAHRSVRLHPMVGREQELALVLEHWRHAQAGEGQSVLLIGEAGIGKSRLVRAALDTLAGEDFTALRYQCSPYHTGTALWPVAQQLALAAGLAKSRKETAKLARLKALLRQGADEVEEVVPLIAALLGIDVGGSYPDRELSPQQRRLRTLAALVEQLLGLTRHEPVLMVLEDAHWIDPTTLELAGLALRIAHAPVLMLLTSRPDGQPDLRRQTHVTRLTLNRLGRRAAETMVANLAGRRCLPPAVMGAITARTDGVPLFVEELTRRSWKRERAERRQRCRSPCTPR
jgi:class 3 adenylate cyclase